MDYYSVNKFRDWYVQTDAYIPMHQVHKPLLVLQGVEPISELSPVHWARTRSWLVLSKSKSGEWTISCNLPFNQKIAKTVVVQIFGNLVLTSVSEIAPDGIGRYGSFIASISLSYQSFIVCHNTGSRLFILRNIWWRKYTPDTLIEYIEIRLSSWPCGMKFTPVNIVLSTSWADGLPQTWGFSRKFWA
jgi:hypothetical protein